MRHDANKNSLINGEKLYKRIPYSKKVLSEKYVM